MIKLYENLKYFFKINFLHSEFFKNQDRDKLKNEFILINLIIRDNNKFNNNIQDSMPLKFVIFFLVFKQTKIIIQHKSHQS